MSAVGRDGPGAFDHQQTRRVVEAEEVQLAPRRCPEDVGRGERRGPREVGHARRLDGDVEGVLQHARREHVHHQLWRDRADADLSAGQRLAVEADQAPRQYVQRQQYPLRRRQVRCGGRVRHDHRTGACVHAHEDVQVDPRQVHLGHPGHGRIHDAGHHLDVHHHLGEVEASGRRRSGLAIDRKLDDPGWDRIEREAAVRLRKDGLAFQAQDEDFHALDGQQEHVVAGVRYAVGAGVEVVVGHRVEIGAGVHDEPRDGRAGEWDNAHGREGERLHATGEPVAVGVQRGAARQRKDARAIDGHFDDGRTRHLVGFVEEEPRE